MSGLRTRAGTCSALSRALLDRADTERCAIGYAHHDPDTGSWVLAEIAPVAEAAYAKRDAVSASLKPAALVAIANRARAERLSPVFVHTHPHAMGAPRFSPIDDAGEAEIKAYLDRRAPDAHALAMVIGPDGLAARELGSSKSIDVWEVGERLTLLGGTEGSDALEARHDRQVRAFGAGGQRRIERLKLLVVGAGGTGMPTIQQLAHLGARDLTIVDPDCVETTNLNRLVGATPGDVGLPKVEVARRLALSINPAAQVRAIVGDIVDEAVARWIGGFDFVFLCTDSHASRAVVGQAAYQHLVPAIDMGVSITTSGGEVTHVTGRVQMLAPRLPCLVCTRALDRTAVKEQRQPGEQVLDLGPLEQAAEIEDRNTARFEAGAKLGELVVAAAQERLVAIGETRIAHFEDRIGDGVDLALGIALDIAELRCMAGAPAMGLERDWRRAFDFHLACERGIGVDYLLVRAIVDLELAALGAREIIGIEAREVERGRAAEPIDRLPDVADTP